MLLNSDAQMGVCACVVCMCSGIKSLYMERGKGIRATKVRQAGLVSGSKTDSCPHRSHVMVLVCMCYSAQAAALGKLIV